MRIASFSLLMLSSTVFIDSVFPVPVFYDPSVESVTAHTRSTLRMGEL